MSSLEAKKILLVPLDWGLGHTTRCIPIITELIGLGHTVYLGGTATTNAILQLEFPQLSYYEFPSYGISYPEKGTAFMKHIVGQLPQMAKVIRAERKRTAELARELDLDVIISDNRFGVRHSDCKNIFISHQLNLVIPQSSLLQWAANRINRFFINKYDTLFVPDHKSQLLSGALSDPKRIRIPISYLGFLSRWRLNDTLNSKRQLLVILSGPEPQRSLLEDLLIGQCQGLEMEIHIVRAKPDLNELPDVEGIQFYNHLSGEELKKLAEESDLIISRAGYTTIMDLVAIKKHAILIPTPGQTEQEYLAEHLNNMSLFKFYNQKGFDVKEAIRYFAESTWKKFPDESTSLVGVLKDI